MSTHYAADAYFRWERHLESGFDESVTPKIYEGRVQIPAYVEVGSWPLYVIRGLCQEAGITPYQIRKMTVTIFARSVD